MHPKRLGSPRPAVDTQGPARWAAGRQVAQVVDTLVASAAGTRSEQAADKRVAQVAGTQAELVAGMQAADKLSARVAGTQAALAVDRLVAQVASDKSDSLAEQPAVGRLAVVAHRQAADRKWAVVRMPVADHRLAVVVAAERHLRRAQQHQARVHPPLPFHHCRQRGERLGRWRPHSQHQDRRAGLFALQTDCP